MSRRARRGGEQEGEREKGTNIMMGRMRRFNCEEGREDREREGQFRERKIHSVSVRAKERKSMLSLSRTRRVERTYKFQHPLVLLLPNNDPGIGVFLELLVDSEVLRMLVLEVVESISRENGFEMRRSFLIFDLGLLVG